MKKKSLHPVQEALLRLLTKNQHDPLTVRELQEELGLSSTSTVSHHTAQLEKKGYIKRNAYNPRDYQIIEGDPEEQVSVVNLYGMAQCGPDGSILDGNPVDRIPIASRLISFPVAEAFMVKAKGDSMEPKIHEGDFVIARRTTEFSDNKVYVCVNDGMCLIKRIKHDGQKIILISDNKACFPFLAEKNFRIEGEVKGVISHAV